MISELTLNQLEEKLKTDEYIPLVGISFPQDYNKTWEYIKAIFIFIFSFLGILLILGIFVAMSSDNLYNKDTLVSGCGFLSLLTAIIISIKYILNNTAPEDFIKKANKIKKEIEVHNKNIYNNTLKSELDKQKIENLTKKIIIYHLDYNIEEFIGVNDEDKFLAYCRFNMDIYGKYTSTIIKANYKNVIKYAFIDKSTTTQTATSITSSNSGKSLGGAVVSGLLIGDATAGAVIGGSGERKTETTYKTTVNNAYQIVIYLNSLEHSTITINTNNGKKVNDIIAMIEYILRNQNNA